MDESKFKILAVFVSAILTHYYQICIVGVCDQKLECFQPTIGSVCFVISVCSLLANRSLYPCNWQKLPFLLSQMYHILIYLMAISSSVRLIWIPFTENIIPANLYIAQVLARINTINRWGRRSFLWKLKCFLQTETAFQTISTCSGLLILFTVGQRLDLFSQLLAWPMCFIHKIKSMIGLKTC